MTINRHNYESFFLRCADNALSKTEAAELDIFLALNPDLRGELDAMLATILPVEEIRLPGKNKLLRDELSATSLEQLLLLADGELDPATAARLESEISKSPSLKKEWSQLQAAVLPVEEFQFPDKAKLYRRQGQPQILWYRAAAAAILIALIAFGTRDYFARRSAPSNVHTTEFAAVKTRPGKVTATIATVTTVHESSPALTPAMPVAASQSVREIKHEVRAASDNHQANASPETAIAVNNASPLNTSPIAVADPVKQSQKPLPAATAEAPLPEQPNSYAITVAMPETVTDNKILYVNADELSRSKAVGGLLRKVKKFVVRTAKIKPGQELAVAGFSFSG